MTTKQLLSYIWHHWTTQSFVTPFKMYFSFWMWSLGDFSGSFKFADAFKDRANIFVEDMKNLKEQPSLILHYAMWVFMHVGIVFFYFLHAFQKQIIPIIMQFHPDFHYEQGDFLPTDSAIGYYLGTLTSFTAWRKNENVNRYKTNPNAELEEKLRGSVIIVRWHLTTTHFYLLSRIFVDNIYFDNGMFYISMAVTGIFALGQMYQSSQIAKITKTQ